MSTDPTLSRRRISTTPKTALDEAYTSRSIQKSPTHHYIEWEYLYRQYYMARVKAMDMDFKQK